MFLDSINVVFVLLGGDGYKEEIFGWARNNTNFNKLYRLSVNYQTKNLYPKYQKLPRLMNGQVPTKYPVNWPKVSTGIVLVSLSFKLTVLEGYGKV